MDVFPAGATSGPGADPAPQAKRLHRLRAVAAAVAIAACLPYAALKVAWLTGSSVGSATALGAESLHDTRHVVGNVATLAMELVAVMLALAFSHRRGQKLPAAVVLIPVWVGTGLLAPIALGLPLGIIAQAIVGGSPAPADNGLHAWVYAVVYGGFVVQAVALLTAFILYARVRWAEPVRLRIREMARGPRPRRLAGAGAAAAVVYAGANLAWAVAGESLAAPPNFDTAAQKSLLVSTGLLALLGAYGMRQLRRLPDSDRWWAPLTLSWLGSAATFASGLSQYALAADAGATAPTSLLLALGTISGLMMAVAALRAIAPPPAARPPGSTGRAGVRGSRRPWTPPTVRRCRPCSTSRRRFGGLRRSSPAPATPPGCSRR
jgi:hypothetical protein